MGEPVRTGHAQFLGSRGEQQDAWGIQHAEDWRGAVLAVVADGIGGHALGGDASELAVQAFLKSYRSRAAKGMEPAEALQGALRRANAAVCEFAEIQGVAGDCGTTLVAAVLDPKSRALHWISVGDSRLYLFREGEWARLTMDGNHAHRLAQKIVQGTLTGREEMGDQAALKSLTSFLGIPRPAYVDRSLRPLPLHPGDWAVLCSDGLYESLDAAEIAACLQGGPKAAGAALVQALAAKDSKNQDNATAAILAYGLETAEPEAEAGAEAPPPEPPRMLRLRWALRRRLRAWLG